jgi:RNA polymerase sigma factor (sigma-70 family)
VLKKSADTELMTAIRSSMVNQFYATVEVRPESGISSDSNDVESLQQAARQLSEREREVLVRVAQGLTNQQVADLLALSIKTIESYRARLMHKLELRTRAELVSFALKTGLLYPRTDYEPDSPKP